jgi:hypothetical protein
LDVLELYTNPQKKEMEDLGGDGVNDKVAGFYAAWVDGGADFFVRARLSVGGDV